MSQATRSFSIRALASGGTTIEDLRNAVLAAAPEANLVLLRYKEGKLRFPPSCPNCGQVANSRLKIERPFLIYVYNSGDSGNYTEPSIDVLEVPFCATCVRRQDTEQVAPGPWTPVKRIFSEAEGFAGLAVIGISGLFFSSALRTVSLFPLLLGCLPLMIGIWLIRPVWKKSHYMSLPQPTNIDMAVDFTPTLGMAHEPGWRAFQFRSGEYAEQFQAANARLLWSPHSEEARSAAELRQKDQAKSNLIAWVFGGAVLLWILWVEVLKDFALPWFRHLQF
jgi:hypothetical protein